MSRTKSPPMTAEMAAYAKHLVSVCGFAQHHAAAILGVNQGRISEVMTGKRFADVTPSPIPPRTLFDDAA